MLLLLSYCMFIKGKASVLLPGHGGKTSPMVHVGLCSRVTTNETHSEEEHEAGSGARGLVAPVTPSSCALWEQCSWMGPLEGGAHWPSRLAAPA